MKIAALFVLAAALAGSPAPARAPDAVELRILPLQVDQQAGTVTLWLRDLMLLLHLAGRECEGT